MLLRIRRSLWIRDNGRYETRWDDVTPCHGVTWLRASSRPRLSSFSTTSSMWPHFSSPSSRSSTVEPARSLLTTRSCCHRTTTTASPGQMTQSHLSINSHEAKIIFKTLSPWPQSQFTSVNYLLTWSRTFPRLCCHVRCGLRSASWLHKRFCLLTWSRTFSRSCW